MLALRNVIAGSVAATLIALAGWTRANADTIYWSDGGTIHAFDVAGGHSSTLVTATGYGAGGNQINQPVSLAVGPDGNLYAGNGDSGTIVKVTPQGVPSTFFASPYGDTSGLAFDASGNLYDAQYGAGEVAKVTPNGQVSPFVSGLNHPEDGTFDPAGNYYVITGGSAVASTAVMVTPAGAASTFATGIAGLVWDKQGNLYEGMTSGTVTLTTPSGSTSTIASGLNFPIPLGVDASGNVYVWVEPASGEAVDLVSPSGQISQVVSIPGAYAVAIAVPEPASLAAGIFTMTLLTRRRRPRPGRISTK